MPIEKVLLINDSIRFQKYPEKFVFQLCYNFAIIYQGNLLSS